MLLARLLLTSALLFAVPAAASNWAVKLLDDATAAYQQGDYARARAKYRRLAGHGSAIAETMLGTMYAQGQGVRRDLAVAAAYYFRAANRGYPAAQVALADMTRSGQGVAADPTQALVWYLLAERTGQSPIAARAHASAAQLRARMQSDDIADAERQVRRWRPWPDSAD